MSTTSPLSTRSRRILEESSRHMLFAERSLNQLSIDEYLRLGRFCSQTVAPFVLSERLADVKYLGEAINVYLAERGQP